MAMREHQERISVQCAEVFTAIENELNMFDYI